MKKLALLLGALSLVSSVAYAKEVVPAVEEVVVVEEAAPVAAAPALRVTSVGQFIEVDNNSGSSNIGEDVFFGNTVGLAYGDDWTFGLMASKIWDVDTEGVHSKNHRIELDAWRHFDNFSVGARWRQESGKDRYLARVKYNYGMFSGWVDAGYESQNSHTDLEEISGNSYDDNWYSEGMPLAVTVGPVTVGYYYEYLKYVGNENITEDDFHKSDLRHQLRAMFPIYNGEKLTLSGEYRYQFAQDVDQYSTWRDYEIEEDWQEKTAHVAILNASYAVTDALTVSGYYRYDFNEYEAHGNISKDKADNYYGEFSVGWNYAF